MAKKTRKKKAANRPKASKRASRDRYAHIESEIINQIVGPRIQALWSQGHQTPSVLRAAYNTTYMNGHGAISEAAFKDWLRLCGFTRQPSTLSAPAVIGMPAYPHPAKPEPAPEPRPRRRSTRVVNDPLRYDGDLDAPDADVDEPQPMLTPPPDLMPGDPEFVLSNPNA